MQTNPKPVRDIFIDIDNSNTKLCKPQLFFTENWIRSEYSLIHDWKVSLKNPRRGPYPNATWEGCSVNTENDCDENALLNCNTRINFESFDWNQWVHWVSSKRSEICLKMIGKLTYTALCEKIKEIWEERNTNIWHTCIWYANFDWEFE